MLKKKSRPIIRSGRKKPKHGRFLPTLEPLGDRILPAITVSFSAGQLHVVGDELDNTIVISRAAAGAILVNGGAIPIQGVTVANTSVIFLNGGDGNDNLSLNETNGALPVASLDGGAGNDVLTGGSVGDSFNGAGGNDTIFGGAGNDAVVGGTGNDTAFLGAGDDTFQWNLGEGSDVVEGQGGRDTLLFNGSDLAEKFDISDSGTGLPFHRVRLTRDVGNVTMDLNGIETIDLNANGGADTITVNDQSATNISTVNLNLGTTIFNGTVPGDGQTDAVIINGTAGDDFGQIAAFDSGTRISAVVSFFPIVNITGAEATNDMLTVNALGGNDVVDASFLPANLIGLTLNGGAGNDTLIGGDGNDLVNGGTGNDAAFLGAGDDTFVWNPGDGSDTVDGQAGFDRMVFNGSDASEKFDISANGTRVRFTRHVGGITMDLNGVDDVDLNALGGADTITVNDQSATDLFQVNLNLNSSAGNGDGQADSVVVNGTNQADVVRIVAFDNGNTISVGGLLPKVSITGAEGANDRLTVNVLDGDDVVDASNLPANLIGLIVNGGAGNDCILGSLDDGGFESLPVGAGTFGSFRYDPAGTPWTFTGLAGISGNGSGFTSGNPNAPEGAQVAFLQGTGAFSQTVAGLAAGTYQLTFQAAQRGNFQASRQDFRVLVDGIVAGIFTPSGTGYSSLTATFRVAAGSHTITFQGLDSAGGDNTAFVDNIRFNQAPPVVPDGGFEAPAMGAGSFQYGPAGSPWIFAGGSGISGNGSGFTAGNPNAPEGAQVAFLQGTGAFSQAVGGLAAGTYQLTFQAAQRGNFQASRQDFRVLVDGIVVGTFTPSGTGYAGFTTAAFTVGAGTHVISFQGLDSAGGDNTAFVDAIRLIQ